jgi:hypothetical protein
VVSQTPSHHSLVFGAHLAKVAVVDLLPITDHIKDQTAVEVDEDISFSPFVLFPHQEPTKGVVQQRWSLLIDYLTIVDVIDEEGWRWLYIQGGRKGVMGRQAFEPIDRRV